jgi:pyruvate dehydrogenase E2 component (dihydrolipoamide acetyltransferase)
MSDVAMPRLSDSMEEGTILKWLKADGDEIARGDELVEIETDKATMTYEADSAGTLSIVAQEGETLPIGQVIARIGGGGEAPASQDAEGSEDADASADDGAAQAASDGVQAGAEEAAPAAAAGAASGAQQAEASGNGAGDASSAASAPAATMEPPPAAEATAASAAGADAGGNGGRPKASPVARRIARERGVDLSTLQGSGPGGRIVKADVEAAAEAGGTAAPAEPAAPEQPAAPAEPAVEEEAAAAPPPPAPVAAESGTAKGDVTTQDLSRIQQVIARRMAESKATVPEFTITTDVDMEGAVELRGQLKAAAESTGVAVPSYNDMVVKASAIALREFPRANGSYKDGKFELYSRVNIGVAVAAQDSLVVPTVFDVDRKSLGEIARDSRGLAERVRAGAITPPELSGGTFTVSNLGMFGVTEFVAVINPPQAAILAVGKMEPRAVVRDGEIVARNTMNITLSCDHRILYGADAAQFLARIKALLEQPIALAL